MADEAQISQNTEETASNSRNEQISLPMPLDPTRSNQLLSALASVTKSIAAAKSPFQPLRLVLVSKLHPSADILCLHNEGHKYLKQAEPFSHFGENYMQELQHKASVLPKAIKWHFIGGLQTNKCKPLASSVANLWCVSSVDTSKKADALEKGRAALEEQLGSKVDTLRVHVQVNTSGEESKSGVQPSEALALCKHVLDSCPHLQLIGLMTIGALARSRPSTSTNTSENEDYICLKETRDKLIKDLSMSAQDLELSMGMSGDFESAIQQGSNEVRVGSTIFGSRPATGSLSIEEIENRSKKDDS